MPGRIEVVDENGQKLIFFVTRKETVIADKQGLAISFYKISMGDEVIVYYTKEPHNRKVARFIKLME
jgi:hypothetical protein